MKLLTALEKADRSDLDEVRKEIGEADAKLVSLKLVEKLLAAKFGEAAAGKPGRKAKAPANHPASPAAVNAEHTDEAATRQRLSKDQRRLQVARYLLISGPKTAAVIAIENSMSDSQIYDFLNHNWFIKGDDRRFSLSPSGREAAAKAGAK